MEALHTAIGEAPPPSPGPPRLLDRVRQAIRGRHYSRRTEAAYTAWIRRFILYHGKRHPSTMGEAEISRFLSSLALESKVSASTQNQALSAVLFLYREVLGVDIAWLDDVVRAKTPRRLPVVLTKDEVKTILSALTGTQRLMATLLYGAGLRLMECVRLRVKDIDFQTSQIVVRGGKGDKDRVTMLPAAARPPLAMHLKRVREQHQRDLRHGAGRVALPLALERKYPHADHEWGWQYVFPATRHYRELPTGERRRHHLHESVLQRAVKEAVRRTGILKPASCHTFRHSFATHLLEDGPSVPT